MQTSNKVIPKSKNLTDLSCNTTASKIQQLDTFLNNVVTVSSKMTKTDEQIAINLLANCWQLLKGSSDQSTWANKIHRIENLLWKAPILSFQLERHGGTVNGSSRANIHSWKVNINTASATIIKTGHCQLYTMSPRFNAKSCAKEIADKILNKIQDETLNWDANLEYVVLNIGKIVPDGGANQTIQGRRKRFRDALESIMLTHNWIRKDKGNKMGFIIN